VDIGITLFAQVLAFVILIWLVNKYMWGPLNDVMEARRAKISDGLSASEQGKKDMELAVLQAEEVLKEAKQEAAGIINQAQTRSSQIVEEAKTTATEEADRVKAGAQAEIDQEVNRAKEALRKQVSDVALIRASKVLGKEIDASTHQDVLDDLVSQL
jgi:F-type H+-transporting ATPase subunit b